MDVSGIAKMQWLHRIVQGQFIADLFYMYVHYYLDMLELADGP